MGCFKAGALSQANIISYATWHNAVLNELAHFSKLTEYTTPIHYRRKDNSISIIYMQATEWYLNR